MNHEKNFRTKCTIQFVTVLVIWVLLSTLLIFIAKSYLVNIGLIVITALLLKFIVRVIININLDFVIFNELNAKKYKEIVNLSKWFSPSIWQRINASFYSGDYQKTIDICSKKMGQTCSIQAKFKYISIIAQVYFEVDDKEKLRLACNKFDKLLEISSNKEKHMKSFLVFKFYQFYLNQQFDECLRISNDIPKNISQKNKYYKIQTIYNNFRIGTIYYKLQKIEQAKEYFTKVINSSSNISVTDLSNEYLSRIEKKENDFKSVEILPNADCKIHTKEIFFRTLIKNILYYTIVLVVLITSLIPQFKYLIEKHNYELQMEEYETKLKSAIETEYDYYEIIEYFYVEKNGEKIDFLCVIKTNEGIDLLSIVTFDNKKTLSPIKYAESINAETSYCVNSVTSDFYIGFGVCYLKDEIPTESYYITRIASGEKETYLYIDYIELIPR